MRARIVIRGLVLFQFRDKDVIAHLIDGYKSVKQLKKREVNVHAHDPLIRYSGLDEAGKIPEEEDIRELRVSLGFRGKGKIQKHPSFVSHVPRLRDIDPTGNHGQRIDTDFVGAQVVIRGPGTILTRDLVTWPRERKTVLDPQDTAYEGPEVPAKVRFWKSETSGYMANGCVVELEGPSAASPLLVDEERMDGAPSDLPPRALEPFTNAKYDETESFNHEVEPDVVEVLVTNFARQRRHPVPWSLHYKWLFEAMKYDSKRYSSTDSEIVALRNYNRDEWDEDEDTLVKGDPKYTYPFPYLPLKDPHTFVPTSPLHDPFFRPICPPGCCGDD